MKKLILILLCLPMIGFGQQQYTRNNPVNKLKEIKLAKSFLLSEEIDANIHKEFWEIINTKYKDIDKRERFFMDIDKEIEELFLAVNIGMRLFYKDALVSLKNGKPYMSKEREDWYETDIIKRMEEAQPKSGETEVYRVKDGHNEMIEKIAKNIPVYNAQYNTDILFTEEMINGIILNLDNEITKVKERLNIILDESYF